jgi:hypothetical protein
VLGEEKGQECHDGGQNDVKSNFERHNQNKSRKVTFPKINACRPLPYLVVEHPSVCPLRAPLGGHEYVVKKIMTAQRARVGEWNRMPLGRTECSIIIYCEYS